MFGAYLTTNSTVHFWNTHLCRVLGGRSTEGCNGGSGVKNTGLWCVDTDGRTLSSSHPSYNGWHWTLRPENSTHINSINTHTDTPVAKGTGAVSCCKKGRGYDPILIRHPVHNPWEAEQIKRCMRFKVWRSRTILEINVNHISAVGNWVGHKSDRETETCSEGQVFFSWHKYITCIWRKYFRNCVLSESTRC